LKHEFLKLFDSDKIVLTDLSSSKEFSANELLEKSLMLAHRFHQDHGIKKNDLIVTLLDSRAETILINFALMHIGAVLIPLNPEFKEKDILNILKQFDANALILFNGQTNIMKCSLRLIIQFFK
jgi:acyl-coenzyme A synthetase/AMP-(fatty) acid ligase